MFKPMDHSLTGHYSGTLGNQHVTLKIDTRGKAASLKKSHHWGCSVENGLGGRVGLGRVAMGERSGGITGSSGNGGVTVGDCFCKLSC